MSGITRATATPIVGAFRAHDGDLEDLRAVAKHGDAKAAEHIKVVTDHTQRIETASTADPCRCIRCGCGLPGKYSFVPFYTLPRSVLTQACCKCVYDDMDNVMLRATDLFEEANPGHLIDWQSIPRPNVPAIPERPVPQAKVIMTAEQKGAFRSEAAGFINLFLYRGRAIFDLVMAAQAGDEEARFHVTLFFIVTEQVKAFPPHYPPSCACCSRDFIPSSLVLAAALPAGRGATEMWPLLLCDSCGDEDLAAVQARVEKRVRRDYPEAHLAWPPLPSAETDLRGSTQ